MESAEQQRLNEAMEVRGLRLAVQLPTLEPVQQVLGRKASATNAEARAEQLSGP